MLPRAEISSKYMPFNYQRLETTPVGAVEKKRYYPAGC